MLATTRRTLVLVLPVALALAVAAGCSESALPPPPQESRVSVLFDLSAAPTDLYAIPYPNDLRRRSDGTFDLGHLSQGQPPLVQSYLDEAARNDYGGFGLNTAAFFRFNGAIDPGCLPATPRDSAQPGSSLFWVNLEPNTPGYGQRIPLSWRFTEAAGKYIGTNALAVLPVPGFVAEPRSHYAILLTEAACDPSGRPLLAPPALIAALDAAAPSDPALVPVHDAYAKLRDYLAQSHLTGVVAATVYTTGDPAMLAGRARRVLEGRAAPAPQNLQAFVETSTYYELRGSYVAPNFQKGTPPFARPADGGGIVVDGNGDPVPQRDETLRFAMTVPKGTMPAGGWPVVIYAHGTGGDYRSFIDEGLAPLLAAPRDSDGSALPGLAMISIDQNLHGPRDPSGGSPDLNAFNFQNAVETVYYMVQGGIDDFSLLRMAKLIDTAELPWATESGRTGTLGFGAPMHLDPKRIYFMGHSQGSITGAVFLAHEPEVSAAMLSGAGGGAMIGLLDKTEPLAVKALLEVAVGEDMDAYHPLLNLMQQMLEPTDPLNYAHMILQHRPDGIAPKHLFVSEGLVDHYAPNGTTDAFATALEIPLAGPVLHPIEALDLRGLEPAALPLEGNLKVGEHPVTAAMVQYRAVETGDKCGPGTTCTYGYCDAGVCRSDGHFVIFDDPRGQQHLARYFGTMARDGVPTIGP